MRKAIMLILALFCIGIMITSTHTLGRHVEAQEIVDDEDDVLCYENVEEEVGGHSDIDLVSLVTEEVVNEVKATLSVKGKISDDEEINYYMMIGNIEIFYYDGEAEVWDINDFEDEELDDIDVTVSGSTITALIPTERLSKTDFEISASAAEYGEDDFEEFTSFSDSIPDESDDDLFPDGGNRGPILNPFDKSYEDEEGDVVKQYMKETVVSDHEHIDIVSLEVTESESDELDVILKMAGPVSLSLDVSYMIFVGDAIISYSAGDGEIYYDDGSDDDDVTVKDDTITAVLDKDKVEDSPYGGLFAVTNEYPMTEDKSYSDSVPEDPWGDMEDYDDMMWMITNIDITMTDLDTTELLESNQDIDSDTASEIRTEIDDYGDGDGEVTQEEIEEYFDFDEDDEMAYYLSEIFAIDGEKGDATQSLISEGLIGKVDSTSTAMIGWLSTVTFELDNSQSHTITIGEEYEDWEDDEYWEEEEDWSDFEEGLDDDDRKSDDEEEEDVEDDEDEDWEDDEWEEEEIPDFSFTAASGWIIDIDTFPEEMVTFLSEDRSSFIIPGEDMEEVGEELEILEFDIIEAPSGMRNSM